MKNKTDASLLERRGELTIAKWVPVIMFFLFFMCYCGESASAQDLLILKSGKEIKANIMEEGPSVIKYRDFDNPGGPMYSVSRDKVASIKYKKGSKEAESKKSLSEEKAVSAESNPAAKNSGLLPLEAKKRYIMQEGKVLSVHNVKTLMEDNPEALTNYDKGRSLCTLSNACAYAVMLTSFITTKIENNKTKSSDKIKAGITGLSIDGGFIIAAIIMASTGKHKIRNSVSMYNSSLKTASVSLKLNLGVQANGMGIAMNF